MEKDLNKRIYKFGEIYYTVEELYNLSLNMNYDKKKELKDSISHFILAQIIKKINLPTEAEIMETIAEMEAMAAVNNLSKKEKIIYKLKYKLYSTKLFLLTGTYQKYKISEFENGEWLLNKIISLTIGSSYPKNSYESLTFIDYEELTEKECEAIVKNYKRNILGAELEFYHSARSLEKRNKN